MTFLEYAPAPESRSILNLREEYGHFIDGTFVQGTGKSFATISPADESHIAMISAASAPGSPGSSADGAGTSHETPTAFAKMPGWVVV